MKSIFFAIIVGVIIAGSIVFAMPFLFPFDQETVVDVPLSDSQDGRIDYVAIGFDASKKDFEDKLASRNVQYDPNDLLFKSGLIIDTGYTSQQLLWICHV